MKNSARIISILFLSVCFFAGKNANAQVTYNYTGSLQTWTVPCGVSSITINAYGAQGGDFNGGKGAEIQGTFAVAAGEVIDIMVGELGPTNYVSAAGGGGGGSFVWNAGTSTLMVAAGGGGGGVSACAGQLGGSGSATNAPTPGVGAGSGTGGSGGNGGSYGTGGSSYGVGGGGCGWNSNGLQNPSAYSEGKGGGGFDPLNGGAGGVAGVGSYPSVTGGYGGGGGEAGNCGAPGGGGGYNGGGGGDAFNGSDWGSGGGGGSYNAGSNQTNTAGVQSGNGMIVITQNSVPAITTASGNVIANELCDGGNSGVASVIVGGSAPAFTTYSWAPVGGSQDTAYGLSAGTYTISVTGYCGSATATVTITQPGPMVATGNVVAEVSCNGANNGKASAIVTGGTMPYTYVWTGGGSRDTASGLSAGIYRAIVTDINGCSCSTTVTITQPNTLTLNTLNTSNASCGISNGSASSVAGGGTMPYTYSWTGGGTTSSISGLSGGTYMLTLMDNNGCSQSSSVIINETPAVFLSASTASNISCNGDNSGSAIANVSGGVAPFTYSWSNGATNFTANGLSAGTYTVNVTDVNGCSSTSWTTITQPTQITAIPDSTVDVGKCTGSAWVIVTGGVPPYTYSWSNGGTTYQILGQCKGTYCCKITDANRCVQNICVQVKSTTGIDNIESSGSGITVYPNPNNGQFTIESTIDAGQSFVEVYSILGEKVYSAKLNSTKGSNTIDMGKQPNGVYLYRIMTENGDQLGEGKIIIQK